MGELKDAITKAGNRKMTTTTTLVVLVVMALVVVVVALVDLAAPVALRERLVHQAVVVRLSRKVARKKAPWN